MANSKSLGRRGFLGSAAGALGASFWADELLEGAVQNVNKNSKPSELKITDLRVATIARAPMRDPIIRIDTNQGIYGLGEVRDGASKTYALILKSRILGENPCNVDKIFRKIKQFGGHRRQAGGVCGIEMALWDLPARPTTCPSTRCWAAGSATRSAAMPIPRSRTIPEVYGQRLKARKEEGFTWLKMDLGIDLMEKIPGTITRPAGEVDHRRRGTSSTCSRASS